jgi:hypothetical protein
MVMSTFKNTFSSVRDAVIYRQSVYMVLVEIACANAVTDFRVQRSRIGPPVTNSGPWKMELLCQREQGIWTCT